MKTLLLLLLLAVPVSAQIETKYDRFKDQTGIILRPVIILAEGRQTISVSLVAVHPGPKFQTPQAVSLFFVSRSPQWLYQSGVEVLAIADNERLNLGLARPYRESVGRIRDSRYSRSGVYAEETIVLTISNETFQKLAKSESLELKIGPAEVTLDKEHLGLFRSFATRIGNPE